MKGYDNSIYQQMKIRCTVVRDCKIRNLAGLTAEIVLHFPLIPEIRDSAQVKACEFSIGNILLNSAQVRKIKHLNLLQVKVSVFSTGKKKKSL